MEQQFSALKLKRELPDPLNRSINSWLRKNTLLQYGLTLIRLHFVHQKAACLPEMNTTTHFSHFPAIWLNRWIVWLVRFLQRDKESCWVGLWPTSLSNWGMRLECAATRGSTARLCRVWVYRPKTKGKVERKVRYIRGDEQTVMKGTEIFNPLLHMAEQTLLWCLFSQQYRFPTRSESSIRGILQPSLTITPNTF